MNKDKIVLEWLDANFPWLEDFSNDLTDPLVNPYFAEKVVRQLADFRGYLVEDASNPYITEAEEDV